MRLHENSKLFKQAVRATAQQMGLLDIYVEKDYWVTFALYTIFGHEIGKQTVFKGGTALSKCYGLIERFSEDIDLVVLRNKLGLTSQVSNTIQIGKKEIRPPLQRDRYKITFVKQKNTITKEYIPLLQILDAIRYIKTIPDATIASSTARLLAILKELSAEDRILLSKLAMKYPPSTRAIVGAMLEHLGEKKQTEMLKQSLNPITIYKLAVPNHILPTAENWNIK